MSDNGKKYKNLEINLDEMENIINAWGMQSEYNDIKVEVPEDMEAKTLNYIVDCDGKKAMVAVFPTKGGVCSISHKFGKEKEISAEIVDFIVSRSGKLANSFPFKNGFTMTIGNEDFGAFYELMKELDDVVVEEDGTDNQKKFYSRLKNKRYGDTITISYYHTEKVLIQGKPLGLFRKAIEIISQGNALERVFCADTKLRTIRVDGDDIVSDMKESLEEAYDYLGRTHKAILASAYILYRTNINTTNKDLKVDYSVIFNPATRVLEGFMFKILVNNNVFHENDETIGYYFTGEDNKNPHMLHPKYVGDIDNDIIVSELNKLYRLYIKVRHQYCHAAENDLTTAIISDRKNADAIFEEIITSINRSYKKCKSAK